MNKFRFDDDGFLQPAELIKCSEREFKDFFINRTDFINRRIRWSEYCEFIGFLKRHGFNKQFKIWIFGSIVGKYKIPSDIDIILWLETEDYITASSCFLSHYIQSNALRIFNVHCDNIFEIPENGNLLDCLRGNILEDEFKNKIKGFIEIEYP